MQGQICIPHPQSAKQPEEMSGHHNLVVLVGVRHLWVEIGREQTFRNTNIGAPGWLSKLSIQLQLRSWSHGSWVRDTRWALCWQLRAWSCFGFCVLLSVSLCPSPVRALSRSRSLSKINKQKQKTKKKRTAIQEVHAVNDRKWLLISDRDGDLY